jgi:hypothetical protein
VELLAAHLRGGLVVVEPLEPAHEDGLWEAAADPEVWRWMPVDAGSSRDAFAAWFEGIFRKHMLVRDGELRDSAWYAIVDDDWLGVRASLERRLAARPRRP